MQSGSRSCGYLDQIFGRYMASPNLICRAKGEAGHVCKIFHLPFKIENKFKNLMRELGLGFKEKKKKSCF